MPRLSGKFIDPVSFPMTNVTVILISGEFLYNLLCTMYLGICPAKFWKNSKLNNIESINYSLESCKV